MKKYTITIEVAERESKFSFAEDLKNEIKQDRVDFELTEAINEATTKLHKQILEKFLEPVNEELNKLGLGFTDHQYSSVSNGYKSSMFILRLPKQAKSYVIEIRGESERSGEFKYVTYTGKYKIRRALIGVLDYLPNQKQRMGSNIVDEEHLFKIIKHWVKEEIK